MSDLLILPDFPGMDIAYDRIPLYTTNVQNTPSGREVAISYESYPRYEWALKFNVLRNFITVAEALQLEAIFHLLQGRGDYFLFRDPERYSATDVNIGTGNGANAQFRLGIYHTDPASGLSKFEPVQNPYYGGGIIVKVAGVTKTVGTHYNVSAAGLVTFTAGNIPTAGQAVTWTGNFRYRCRLLDDKLVLKRSHSQIWNSQIKFRSVKV